MPLDGNGIWSYTGGEQAAPADAMLNRLAGSTSTQVAALRNEIAAMNTRWDTYLRSMWTAFTPTWGTEGATPPTLGNGLVTCRYRHVGYTVEFVVFLRTGTSTNGGAGNWTWTLPVACQSGLVGTWPVYGWLYNSGTVVQMIGGRITASSNKISNVTDADKATLSGSYNLNVNSELTLAGTYEAMTAKPLPALAALEGDPGED